MIVLDLGDGDLPDSATIDGADGCHDSGWRRDQVLGCSLISRGMSELDLAPAGRCCPLYSGGESYLGSSLVDVFTPPTLRVVVVVAAPVNNKLRKN